MSPKELFKDCKDSVGRKMLSTLQGKASASCELLVKAEAGRETPDVVERDVYKTRFKETEWNGFGLHQVCPGHYAGSEMRRRRRGQYFRPSVRLPGA